VNFLSGILTIFRPFLLVKKISFKEKVYINFKGNAKLGTK